MICNPVLTSIMLFLNLFARWKQVLQVPHVPVAGSMFVPRPEFHWGATSVHRSGRRLVAGGPVNQWPWLIFMVLGKNGFQVETSFVHEVFVETWMQLFFWVGHLFSWNIILYVDYLFIKQMGYPASYPTKHSKCWSMIFWKHLRWWNRQAGPISQALQMDTVGRHYNS